MRCDSRPRIAREALDFIGHLEIKHGLRDVSTEGLKSAQAPAMRHVWDHPEDEIRNGL